ncbi:methylmalonyl-CoA carboxyltransferase, partial [Streptomyces collinus]
MPLGFCSVVPGKRPGDCTESTARNPWCPSYGRYMTVLEETTGEPTGEPTDARGRVAELHEIRAQALGGPSEKATEAQHAKGKLTARER